MTRLLRLLCHLSQVARRVSKIEDPHHIVPMAVYKGSQPIGSIEALHRPPLPAPPLAAQSPQRPNRRICQSRKGGMRSGSGCRLLARWSKDFTDHYRFDFCPDASSQRHQSPISQIVDLDSLIIANSCEVRSRL
jgi:hypothetical protein